LGREDCVCGGLRNGVVPAAGKGMASDDAAQRKPASTKPSMADDCDVRVLAAGWEVFALGSGEDMQKRRDAALVEDEQSGGQMFAA